MDDKIKHKNYEEVVRDSQPLFYTKMLESKLVWVQILAIIFVYVSSAYITYAGKLANLDPLASNDYFD